MVKPIKIQPFSSRFETPRVKLSNNTYKIYGVNAFHSEKIPFADRSSSKFAKGLVALLVTRLQKLQELKPSSKLHIYELGGGTGLLAYRMLTILKTKHQKIYTRTILHLTDYSQKALNEVKKYNEFAEFKNHIRFEEMDATKPRFTHKPILIYFVDLLDSLPCRHIINIENRNVFEITVQTTLNSDVQIVDTSGYPPKVLNASQIATLINSNSYKRQLLLAPQFIRTLKEEYQAIPINDITNISESEKSALQKLIDLYPENRTFNYSYKASVCIEKCLSALIPGGFLVFSDFGRTDNTASTLDLWTEFGRVIAFPFDFAGTKALYQSSKYNLYLAESVQGGPQEMLIDTISEMKVPKIFKEHFGWFNQKIIETFLDSALTTLKSEEAVKEKVKKIEDELAKLPDDVQSDYMLLNNLGNYYLSANLFAKAMECAEIINKEYVFSAGYFHHYLAGRVFASKSNLSKSLDHLKMAAAYSDPESMAFIADIYFQTKNHQDYIPTVKEYIKYSQKKDYLKSLFLIAQVQELQGKRDESKVTLAAILGLGENLHQTSNEEKEIIKQANDKLQKYNESQNVTKLVNTAITHGQKGNFQKAIKYLKLASKKLPNNLSILYNLGFAYQNNNNPNLAITTYKQALLIEPNNIELLLNLGQVYQMIYKFEKAKKTYQKAINLNPNFAEAYNNLGLVFVGLDNLKAAIKTYNKALRINPNLAKVYTNLGAVYYYLNNFKKAVRYFKKAIQLDPNYSKTYIFLGLTFTRQNKTKQAINNFTKALEFDQDNASIYYHIGILYKSNDDHEKALSYFKKSVATDPYYMDAVSSVYHGSLQICDWQDTTKQAIFLNEVFKKGVIGHRQPWETPFDNITRTDDLSQNQIIASTWSYLVAKRVETVKPDFIFKSRKKSKRKLRIGYISNDYRNHVMGYLVPYLFQHSNQDDFEVFAYSHGENDKSGPRIWMEQNAQHFVELREKDNIQAAEKIYKDRIDILVDLMSYTAESRFDICAMRPAPIQITYLGFPGTTGADFIDYIVTDKVLTPPHHEKYFTEKFIYMPSCYQIMGDFLVSKKRITRKKVGLPENTFVFSSFNRPNKIDPVIFKIWMNILKRVPKSVLWIYSGDSKLVERNLIKEAGRFDINKKRIVFAPKLPLSMHMKRLSLADLALDTKTYSGGATTGHLLYQGIPVVALTGKHYLSRMSSSLVTASGLPELAVDNLEKYENLAVELAIDSQRFAKIKSRLAGNNKNGTLFKPDVFMRNLEKGYKKIFELFENRKKPQSFSIDNLP